MAKLSSILLSGVLFFCGFYGYSQEFGDQRIANFIEELKQDPRGPYRDIKWFCEDGTIRDARDPCPEPSDDNVQHARYKESVIRLAEERHIFFGQILIGTDKRDFWDEANRQSRLKQYIMEQYLYGADDGWIARRAQYYRGAKQMEDEAAWGTDFLHWALASEQRVRDHYLLLRLATSYLPHGEESEQFEQIRLLSTRIAENYSAFMDPRTKIHNSPERSDLDMVIRFSDAHCEKMSPQVLDMTERLMGYMFEFYDRVDPRRLDRYARLLENDPALESRFASFRDALGSQSSREVASAGLDLLHELKYLVFESPYAGRRRQLLEMSNFIESQVISHLTGWKPESFLEMGDKICHISRGLAGCGYLAEWEHAEVFPTMASLYEADTSVAYLEFYRNRANQIVLWSTQMLSAIFQEDVESYRGFEPLILGLQDQLVRSSIILSGGQAVEALNQAFTERAELTYEIMGEQESGSAQGLNPGMALGVLQVIEDESRVEVQEDRIYVFRRPPADLGPVAGIATVEEGNPVSHVQLLARNLGIPNAVISQRLMDRLKKYDGREVFFAVSPKGGVLIRAKEDLDKDMLSMVTGEENERRKIRVATEELRLEGDTLLNMARLGSEASGKWCGPKAANLGQLKKMFPDKVVEGIVLPFGIFREHMEQRVPGMDFTYWQYLNRTFARKNEMERAGENRAAVERMLLERLDQLRTYIEQMPLKPSLVGKLENSFREILGGELGSVPVFLRSDTNMEDLEEFTGAGLNLTLFNVLDRQAILEGIRKVWASPYTERSYRWRQYYLENPEDVYPSILIIPSVNVEKSGVLITTGLHDGIRSAITAAFSRGVGGAVDGQTAETWELYPPDRYKLIAPGRETLYRTIPPEGGSELQSATLNWPILHMGDMWQILQLTEDVRRRMENETGMEGPYDIELGFKADKLWLFQIRPFVENEAAKNSAWLAGLDPEIRNEAISLQ